MKRKKRNNIIGRGIQRPYVSKRNRLIMLGKGKKQKGGFFASLIDEIWG